MNAPAGSNHVTCSKASYTRRGVETAPWRSVTQMYGLLDQLAANIGATFMPSIGWVWAIAVFFVLVNSVSYVVILHAVYTIVLGVVVRPDYVNAPKKVKKMLGVP